MLSMRNNLLITELLVSNTSKLPDITDPNFNNAIKHEEKRRRKCYCRNNKDIYSNCTFFLLPKLFKMLVIQR